MIAKCKRVACTIGPAKVHRGRLKVEAPCIFDMLTDVVEDGVNREDLSLAGATKKLYVNSAYCSSLPSAGKASQVVAWMASL